MKKSLLILCVLALLGQIGSFSAQAQNQSELCLDDSQYRIVCIINGELINLSMEAGGEMGFSNSVHFSYNPDGSVWGALHVIRNDAFDQLTYLYVAETGESISVPYGWPDEVNDDWAVFTLYERLGQDAMAHNLVVFNLKTQSAYLVPGSEVMNGYSYAHFSPNGEWLSVRTEAALSLHQLGSDGIMTTIVMEGISNSIWTAEGQLLTIENADANRLGGEVFVYTQNLNSFGNRQSLMELSSENQSWYFNDYMGISIAVTTGNDGITRWLEFNSTGQ
jgi:hypothetical protein